MADDKKLVRVSEENHQWLNSLRRKLTPLSETKLISFDEAVDYLREFYKRADVGKGLQIDK